MKSKLALGYRSGKRCSECQVYADITVFKLFSWHETHRCYQEPEQGLCIWIPITEDSKLRSLSWLAVLGKRPFCSSRSLLQSLKQRGSPRVTSANGSPSADHPSHCIRGDFPNRKLDHVTQAPKLSNAASLHSEKFKSLNHGFQNRTWPRLCLPLQFHPPPFSDLHSTSQANSTVLTLQIHHYPLSP